MATISTNDNGENAVADRRAVYTAVLDLLPRLEKPKVSPADRTAYRALLEREPGLWRMAGDLGRGAQDQIIKSMGANAALTEAVKVGLDEMREQLQGDDAPRLIKLLVEQVLVCWLQLYQTHYSYTVATSEDHSFAKGDYWQRRLTATQGRYLRALETLARVRRLAIPVQVNIAAEGGQQVNMVG